MTVVMPILGTNYWASLVKIIFKHWFPDVGGKGPKGPRFRDNHFAPVSLRHSWIVSFYLVNGALVLVVFACVLHTAVLNTARPDPLG